MCARRIRRPLRHAALLPQRGALFQRRGWLGLTAALSARRIFFVAPRRGHLGIDARRRCLRLSLQDVRVSEETAKQLVHLQEQVSQGIDQSVNSLLNEDDAQARAVYASLPELTQQTNDVETRIALRLTADEPNRVATYRLESEIIENLKNMYFVAMRIANMVVPRGAQATI